MKALFLTILSSSFLILFSQNRSLDLDSVYAPFYHGVASGDPRSDSIIIWTRISPDSNQTGPFNISWHIATDSNMQNIIQTGNSNTDYDKDYTLKVDVGGLQPYTYYYYNFEYNGTSSLTGRTKTAPLGDIDSLRFAVVSCAHYEAGFFNVYDAIVDRNDVDAVIHLGDYIYEYGRDEYGINMLSPERDYEPSDEVIDLIGYRTRYSQYRLDKSLRRLHQQYPIIAVWDDHESANNSWSDGAQNHNSGDGDWTSRKKASIQAYREWMPLRWPNSVDSNRIYRSFKYGDLASLIFLDTRLYERDKQVSLSSSSLNDTSRTLLGHQQMNWLKQELSDTNTQWKILAQQVMMAPLKIQIGILPPFYFNEDQWNGYPAERDKVKNHILNNSIQNFVVLTGDIHTSWANDLPTSNYNSSTGGGSFGVEFVTPSVTSPALEVGGTSINLPSVIIKAANNHNKFVNTTERGFFILDINKTRSQADWYFINTISERNSDYSYAESWYVNDQNRFLKKASSYSQAKSDLDASYAPDLYDNNSYIRSNNYADILGLYPNPVNNILLTQIYLPNSQKTLSYSIIDMKGQLVRHFENKVTRPGLNILSFDLTDLNSGNYILCLKGNGIYVSKKITKH
ncbi:MAG TPA: T9SS type A sorting domain-containing protein [Bacteroidetes bacterium]|nr:T9SS type A sorting domain-containing protein [Bacteroidota bacterium]